ncbi:MAG: histidinol-phosphate transaminase [Cyanobacteria bacterium P01_A01_bin.84]
MLPFIRPDLADFSAYKPHPGSDTTQLPVPNQKLDRLDTNESPYDLPPELKQKLACTYQQRIETNRYPDGAHQELKDAIAQYVNSSVNLLSSQFKAENISIGNGSDELIRSLLIASCLGGEGSILIAQPTFSMYAILAKTLGIPVVEVNRNEENFEIDLQAAQTAIEKTKPIPIKTVFVVHPNSPTANPLNAAELRWLKGLPENILVVVDEAYFEFSQNSLVNELIEKPNWVILRTFSKAFRLAAMRVGYCIAHPELITVLEKIRLPYNLPSFSIASALIAIQNKDILLASIPQTLVERDNLILALSVHPMLKVWKSSANFVYLQLEKNLINSHQNLLTFITQELKESGTLIRKLNKGLRITIGTPEENTCTISRLRTVLANLKSEP